MKEGKATLNWQTDLGTAKRSIFKNGPVSRTLISVDFKNKPRCDSLENSAKHCQHEKSRDHAAEKRERRVHPGHVDLGASESFESRTLLGFLHGRGNSSERRTRKSTLRPGRQAAWKRLQHDEPRRKHPHCERGRRGAGKRDGVRARGKRRDETTAQPRSSSGSESKSQHQHSNYCTLFLSQPLTNSTNSEKNRATQECLSYPPSSSSRYPPSSPIPSSCKHPSFCHLFIFRSQQQARTRPRPHFGSPPKSSHLS